MRKILVNKIQCLHCKDEIESQKPGVPVSCKCKKVFVDGGYQYLQRGGLVDVDYKELSKCENTSSTRMKPGAAVPLKPKPLKPAKP